MLLSTCDLLNVSLIDTEALYIFILRASISMCLTVVRKRLHTLSASSGSSIPCYSQTLRYVQILTTNGSYVDMHRDNVNSMLKIELACMRWKLNFEI